MPPEPTHWFALACEDRRHFEAVTRLTDRVLEQHVDWFSEHLRAWRQGPDGAPWEGLKDSFKRARDAGLKVYGHFNGEPGELEAGMIRAQLLLWNKACASGESIGAAFIARDTDTTDRREITRFERGAEQALASGRWPFAVVVAHARPEIEAWYIVGFDPVDASEQERLAAIVEELGFSPVREPERLTSNPRGGNRETKRVLVRLAASEERVASLLDVGLETLRARGASCGLAPFLEQVAERVVPLFTK